jgi:DNA-binding transcriptional ArsR family regulator
MALPSFMQHLHVLEGSGLATSTKDGRVRTFRLAPRPLVLAEDWLENQRHRWEVRFDQLDEYLKALKDQRQ